MRSLVVKSNNVFAPNREIDAGCTETRVGDGNDLTEALVEVEVKLVIAVIIGIGI